MGANTSFLCRAAHTRSKEKAKNKKADKADKAKEDVPTKSGVTTRSASRSTATPSSAPAPKKTIPKLAPAPAPKPVEKKDAESLPSPEPTPDPTTEEVVEVIVPEVQSLPSYATSAATKCLQKQLKAMLKQQMTTQVGEHRYWTLDLSRLDDLYTWHFSLSTFDPLLPLAADMRSHNITAIEIQVKFGPQHPKTPPFIRVVKPRFLQFMNGGGGHVTAGGSICVDMLTMKGWKSDYALDQVLMVVHQALSSREPVPARLIGTGSYSVQEAVSAYIRVANTHGWQVPHNWNKLFTNK